MLPHRVIVPTGVVFAALLFAPDADAAVEIHSPPDGFTATADPCPFSSCTAEIPFEVEVTGEPFDYVELLLVPDEGFAPTLPLCTPGDPIEGTEDCPAPPFTFFDLISVHEGEWLAVAMVTRGDKETGDVELSDPVTFTVLPPDIDPVGPVRLSHVDPLRAAPALRVREATPSDPQGKTTDPDLVEIFGENLGENPFLEVFLAPRPFGEPDLTRESGLPVAEWCLHEVEIVDRRPDTGSGSSVVVRMPELPFEVPTKCGVSGPSLKGSIFQKEWRWVVHDPFIREDREHAYWAIPSPRDVPWADAPPTVVTKPAYPLIDGFGFKNEATPATFDEFLTVYGNNAYLCAGGFGVCLTRVIDPLYLLWWPIYEHYINESEGSCNGMSATSLLMAREELQTETFDPAVLFPVGFDATGKPPVFEDTNFCTPACSPPKVKNRWSHIRRNHGVQISREFLFELLETLGTAIFDPDPSDVTAFRGVPNTTLERVRSDPDGYVVCFFEAGDGHCVTPYRVEGNRIFIYDNNLPEDDSPYIDIVDGEYDYPARSDTPNHGKAIMAFPIDIWRSDRNLLGLKDLSTLIGGVDMLAMITAGSADMTVTDDTGGAWGFADDGSFTDALPGAVAMPPLGPNDEPARSMPLFYPMDRPSPGVEVSSAGGDYRFHAAQGGHLLQLEAGEVAGGAADEIGIAYREGDLGGLEFSPANDTARVVPHAGLDIAEDESAVFHWLGLEVPSGDAIAFGGDQEQRAVDLKNNTKGPARYILAVDHGSGPADEQGRTVYGPFEMPEGASQAVTLIHWPDASTVLSEVDLDGDGEPDVSEEVDGHQVPLPADPRNRADLSVEKDAEPETVDLDEPAIFQLVVRNEGPDPASDVRLTDRLPPYAEVSSLTSTAGTCAAEDAVVSCELGSLPPGASVEVEYHASAPRPAALTNGAFVTGAQDDPDMTNNTAVAAPQVALPVDIRPGSDVNPVNTRAKVLPVAILGSAAFDVAVLDRGSLRFGPDEATAVHGSLGHVEDVNGDGWDDLLVHFDLRNAGLTTGDEEACVTGLDTGGLALFGCDSVTVVH